ncbi:MAG: glycosyltransferase, partial [Candidatus Helarchaeota archaeon]
IWYQKCDLVAVYSQAEIFPQHFFEALWFGKPLIHNNAGFIQTIHISQLKELVADFGSSCGEFDEKWKKQYHLGRHFIDAYGWNEKDFAEWILRFYTEEIMRNEIAKKGKEWIDRFASLWSMTDKARLLVEMMKERGYI